MTRFDYVCGVSSSDNPTTENIDRPVRDWAQQTWLAYLETKRDVPNALTKDELVRLFGDDSSLIVAIFNQTRIDFNRVNKGYDKTPKKTRLLEQAFSLDGSDDAGLPWSDVIEDHAAVLPFERIDELDLVINDPRIKAMPQAHQDAIKRFSIAWFLQEAGYSLPNALLRQILRDRRKTGLPLVLRRGRVK